MYSSSSCSCCQFSTSLVQTSAVDDCSVDSQSLTKGYVGREAGSSGVIPDWNGRPCLYLWIYDTLVTVPEITRKSWVGAWLKGQGLHLDPILRNPWNKTPRHDHVNFGVYVVSCIPETNFGNYGISLNPQLVSNNVAPIIMPQLVDIYTVAPLWLG